MSDALGTVFKAVKARLDNANALWDNRVHLDYAPAGVARPYVVYQVSASADANARKQIETNRAVVTVKCVAETMGEAITGASAIRALFADAGAQGGGAVSGDASYQISTITTGTRIHIPEQTPDGKQIYHAGYDFTFYVERI